MSELAETYENFAEPESVKLWRRDFHLMPSNEKALVRYRLPDGTVDWDKGMLHVTGFESEVVGNWPKGAELLGWYPAPNANSDAAYGDPGEGLGS